MTALALAVAFVVVLTLVERSADSGPGDAVPVGRAVGPPSSDQVLQIRDELRAAAASPDYPVDAAALASVVTAPGPYSPLERGPGHWPGTALPGQPGNGVISGHRTTYSSTPVAERSTWAVIGTASLSATVIAAIRQNRDRAGRRQTVSSWSNQPSVDPGRWTRRRACARSRSLPTAPRGADVTPDLAIHNQRGQLGDPGPPEPDWPQ